MSELELKIYESFKSREQYTLSEDMSVRIKELELIDSLESDGSIRVTGRAMGFIIGTAD
ncbi:MAG: hypothetical protein ACERKZ_05860 [Lachnotalea sp.]